MTEQEINEAVSMKLHPVGSCHCAEQGFDCSCSEIRDYSTDISAAWEILARFEQWQVSRLLDGTYSAFLIHGDQNKDEMADTAPMAICLAFLKLPA